MIGRAMSDREHKEFGARRKLTDDELDQLRRLAGLLNVEQIAAYFGISKDNFDVMVKEDPEIMRIYQQGRSSTIGTVAQTLVRKALDGDTQSLIFYLRTQGRWTEKLDVEVKGEVTLASALREMAQTKVIEGDASEVGRLDDAQSKRKLIDQRVTDKGKNSAATMTADDAADRLVKGAKISATNRRRKARRRGEGA
jgi:hypothetical protein